MFYLYNFLLYLLLPVLFIRLILKQAKSKDYQKFSQRGRWKERLGFTPEFVFKTQPIWIHTVSVGEFIAILPLITLLQKKHPDIPIIITTTTMTGSDQVINRFGNTVSHVYIPWDLPNSMARFYQKIKPRMALIMETEIWPNLLFEAKKAQIPVFLINARMSEKSANSYGRISGLTQTMLQHFSYICVQSKNDMQRFLALGAEQNKLSITGNIKFDLTINKDLINCAKQLKQQLLWQDQEILLASSTHPGEDELILESFYQLRLKYPKLKLILVPRHPERFKQVEILANKSNGKKIQWLVTKRSKINSKQEPFNADILIGDSLGEMILYYSLATTVIMGGTFVSHGGHNILEPAALGKPVFYGPSMYNFASINSMFLSFNASIQVKDIAELTSLLSAYLEKPQDLEDLGKRAKNLLEENAGSKNKIYQILQEKHLSGS